MSLFIAVGDGGVTEEAVLQCRMGTVRVVYERVV